MSRRTRSARKLGIVLAVLLVAAGAGAFAALSGWQPPAIGGSASSVVPPPGYGNAGDDAPAAPEAAGPSDTPSDTLSDGASDTSSDGASDGPEGGAAGPDGSELTLSGDIDGPIVVAGEISCSRPPDSTAFAWRLVGSLNRAPITLSFNSNHYTGPDTYNATGISDEHGGFLALELDGEPFGSNGASRGSFTVADESSGSIDADVSDAAGRVVHVSGSWRCTS